MFSLAGTLFSPGSAEDRSSLFAWFIDSMARSDSSGACASALWLGTFADRPRSLSGRGAPEVSRFSWESDQPAHAYLKLRSKESSITSQSNFMRPAQYAVFGLRGAKTEFVVNAPHGYALGYIQTDAAVWSSDGKKLMLTNTFLPLNGVNETEKARRLRPCATAIVDLWLEVTAIAHLDSEGIIDPEKVGIIGFSRTCYHVENALISDPKLFAAFLTLADGFDASYVTYLYSAGDATNIDDDIYGAKPFGAGLKEWVKRAPGFNLDKMQTPVRIEAIGLGSILGEWEKLTDPYWSKERPSISFTIPSEIICCRSLLREWDLSRGTWIGSVSGLRAKRTPIQQRPSSTRVGANCASFRGRTRTKRRQTNVVRT